jgi:hypothetical protein
MSNSGEIRVHGLRQMNRAFAKADKSLKKDLTKTLKKVAEPVRTDAARRALHEVRNIRPPWSDMRTGATTAVVYVAPRERGRRSALRRPNLAGLLMDRAMQPALDAHTGDIETELGRMLDEIGKDWGHGG